MTVQFFKRFRMRFDLERQTLEEPNLPDGYRIWEWDESRLEDHAEAKFLSFQREIDGTVFPCLAEQEGCSRLMREISGRRGFIQEATWLISYRGPESGCEINCGTIQGLTDTPEVGSIQNVGVSPEHRGRQLGTVLISRALRGFRQAGLRYASLEVTAENIGALRLYRRLGFQVVKTVYKAIESTVNV